MMCASIVIRGITIIIQILKVAVKRKRLDRQFHSNLLLGSHISKFTVHFGFKEEDEVFNRSQQM